jgi:hypothetical protein
MEESDYEKRDCYVVGAISLPWHNSSNLDKIKLDRDVVRFMC